MFLVLSGASSDSSQKFFKGEDDYNRIVFKETGYHPKRSCIISHLVLIALVPPPPSSPAPRLPRQAGLGHAGRAQAFG
jgi:hypothetical protein